MKTTNNSNSVSTENGSSQVWSSMSSSEPIMHQAYHELAEQPVVEMDALSQLHANIEVLADLQSRLSFQMREVKYLLKL